MLVTTPNGALVIRCSVRGREDSDAAEPLFLSFGGAYPDVTYVVETPGKISNFFSQRDALSVVRKLFRRALSAHLIEQSSGKSV